MSSSNDDESLSSSSRSEEEDTDDQRDVVAQSQTGQVKSEQEEEPPLSISTNSHENQTESMMPKKRIRLSLKISKKPQDGVVSSWKSEDSSASVSAPRETTVKMEEEGGGGGGGGHPQQALPERDPEPSSPPKKRIKLVIPKAKASESQEQSSSLRSESTQPLAAAPTETLPPTVVVKEEANASVLAERYVGEDDVVAVVVAEPVKKSSSKSNNTQSASGAPAIGKKKTAHVHYNRSVRLPPMSSPGLLIPPGIYRGPVDANGLVSPNVVFTETMDSVGYNLESRTNNPHRGSSVQRIVDDMFDSNVKFCPTFPSLVPEKYLEMKKEEPSDVTPSETEMSSEHVEPESKVIPSLAQRLVSALETNPSSITDIAQSVAASSAQARGVLDVSAMFPLSLTLSYPEAYAEKQHEYAVLVDEREKAIVLYQEEEEKIYIARERSEMKGEKYGGPMKANVKIPPIPSKPEPFKLDDMQGMDASGFDLQYPPLHPPKVAFVDHLDKRCFHITEGRYFGLTSNGIADAHFEGPNAPGIGGLHQSSTSGLATASSSTGGLLFANPSVFSGAKASVALGINSAKSSLNRATKASETSKKTASTKKKATVKKHETSSANSSSASGKKSAAETKKNGPTVTATYADLRKIMEAGGEDTDKMRMVIIKAAVHAARAGKFENRSFRAYNRKVYPDVARAFSNFSGLKPCAKCKGNKQGTYSCRFRRKHDAPDNDGGDSWKVLEPLFSMPIGDLIIKPLKKKEPAGATEKTPESG
ncbi:MAG: hypothetical protein SGILL_001687 [Bacillariaceae sp.]